VILSEQSDEELMSRFCSALDEAAFRILMERHHAKALGYVQKKVFCRHLAEEIVQDSFLRVVRNRDAFDHSKKFAAWFYSILTHCAVDALRQRQRHDSKLEKFALHAEIFQHRARPEPVPVALLLKEIPHDDRALLIDHFINGLTFPELALKYGLPKETLKKRAQRALKKIRNTLPSKKTVRQ
jgi:RNA polymerase sigma-70 factor (ECF subfamily)